MMDNITSNNNANFYWWFGVVEDRNDPLRLGRCRIRIIGYHTEDNEVLPTEDLPWALPVMPANSAGTSGVGWSPTGAVEGSWVVGFFADGENGQHPMFFGTVGAIPGGLRAGDCPPEDGIGSPSDNATTEDGQPQDSESSGPIASGPPNQEFWTLVAMCAAEAESGGGTAGQSYADVAQAIYNRVGAPGYRYNSRKGTVDNSTPLAVMLSVDQYESAWRYPTQAGTAGSGVPNRFWRNITDIRSAAAATGQSERVLTRVAQVLKDPDKQREARRFIGARTDFLAPTQPANAMTRNGSKVQRTRFANQFGFSGSYRGARGPQAVPSSVTNYNLT